MFQSRIPSPASVVNCRNRQWVILSSDIFHLCEAFFYIALQLEYGRFAGYDIFNLWATKGIDDYHENCDKFFQEDRDAILKTHPIAV